MSMSESNLCTIVKSFECLTHCKFTPKSLCCKWLFIEGNSFNANVDLGEDFSTCSSNALLDGNIENPDAMYYLYDKRPLYESSSNSVIIVLMSHIESRLNSHIDSHSETHNKKKSDCPLCGQAGCREYHRDK